MKFLLDFLPIVAFFASFKWAEGHKEMVSQWLTQNVGFLVSGGAVGPKEAPVLLATLIVIVISVLQVVITTDSATSARAIRLTTLLAVPPGQQPTRITPTAISGGRLSTWHSNQANPGMITNCATTPKATRH